MPGAATRSSSFRTLPPAGSLHKLGANIFLLHIAPLLGLDASLSLAATSHFFRALLLHHTLTHYEIPGRLLQSRQFPSSALAAIRIIKIGADISFADLVWILESGMLAGFTSLTIAENQHIARQLSYCDLHQVRTMTVSYTNVVQFVANPVSTGMLRSLCSLTIEYNNRIRNQQPFLPQDFLRALGPASELTNLAISTNSWWVCDDYHSAVLALLGAFSVPGSTPSKLKLLSLAFNDLKDNGNLLPSVIVAAWKGSIANVQSPWRLGHLPIWPTILEKPIELWVAGCTPTLFRLSEKELIALIALDSDTWNGPRLRDFFAGPVYVPGNMLAHVGPLGTALEGIQVDMSYHQEILPIFNSSVRYISLHFLANKIITADPKALLLATSPWLKSFELFTEFRGSERLAVYPRIHEVLVLPTMPNLTIFRTDVRLLLRAGQRRKCGQSQTPHAAARYELGWIPKVQKLRLDGWVGCSNCWRDCRDGTLRHFIKHGAGGAGKVTVRGVFCLFGGTVKGMGCEELWELWFTSPENWQHMGV